MFLAGNVVKRGGAVLLAIVAIAVSGAVPAHATSLMGNRLRLSPGMLRAVAPGNPAERGILRNGAGPRSHANNPGVLPPQSHPFGLAYDEWAVKWWQWAYSVPATGHPLFDETGADCGAGQSGPVWFLGGVFNVSGSATRDLCTVPAGKALFFPILNVEWDNVCPPIDPPLSVDQLRQTAASWMDLAQDMSCEVDGKSIQEIEGYRTGGSAFSVTLPHDNLWQAFGCGTAPGTYSPLVPDGIYLMLAPLSVGPHTLHLRGTIGDPVNFTLDVTYHLTVANGSGHVLSATKYSAEQGGKPGSAVPAGLRTSWGRVKAIYR